MKFRHIVFAVSLGAIASTSFATQLYHPSNAEEGVTFLPLHQSGGLTRDQVRTNVMGAQRDGTLSWTNRGYPGAYPLVQGPKLSNSRGQVEAELRTWQKSPVTRTACATFPVKLAGWKRANRATERPHQVCAKTCPPDHKPDKSQ